MAHGQDVVPPHAPAAAVAEDVRLERMLLLLKPGDAQREQLDTLLDAQQTAGNAEFHKWVTPSEFADRFSLSTTDAAAVVAWLQHAGFTVAPLPVSRGWVEFSGSAAQVRKAFGVSLKAESESGVTRYVVSGSATMPAAIVDKAAGLVSLDGVVAAAAITTPIILNDNAAKLDAASGLKTAMTPKSAAASLHLDAAKQAGTGETIVIPARSDVRAEDFTAFRSNFGLPAQTLSVLPNGTDPGRTVDEAAAIETASWASVAAPGAQIVLVPAMTTNATDGMDLALAAAVDGNPGQVVSVGYTACESALSAVHQAFYAALYRQAAAEGISIVAATGDSGAAACHVAGASAPVSSGLSVNALAATPWNTAVGAVNLASDAKSFTAWEPGVESDAAYATGGGASRSYRIPLWQSALGVPAQDPDAAPATARHRYLPDVSLPAAAGTSNAEGVVFCFSGDEAQSGCRMVRGGGSGAAAAIFSGVAAALVQKYGAQGNLAPNLYALKTYGQAQAKSNAAAAFSDVTEGGARLWCAAGSGSCTTSADGESRIGYDAAEGYDLASGLGTINAAALIANWTAPQATGTQTATVEMTNTGGITYNPSASITLSAKVISGSGGTVPTGTIQFYDETTSGNTGSPVTMAADGTASYVEQGQFSNGGHNIQAKYSGDSIYAAGESQPVTINVQPSPTSLVVTPSTTTPGGGASITVTGVVTATNAGADAPTGTLTVNLDGIAQGTATLATAGGTTSGSVKVTVPTAGAHTVQGTYGGDTNYYNSTSPSVTITVAKVASATTISASPATLTAGVTETLTATVAPATAVAGTTYTLTGSVAFYDGTTLLGTAAVTSDTAILTGVSLSASVTHSLIAVYSGDTTYDASSSSAVVLSATLLPVTVSLTESGAVLAPDQPVTLTATVAPVNIPPAAGEQNPSGYVLFYAGTTLISGQVAVAQGPGDTGIASTVVPHIPAGAYSVTAHYSGDTTFGAAVSNSVSLQAEDFTVACDVTNINMVQGTTQSVNCNVASLGGLSGPIEVVCAEQNSPQVGAISCTFSPNIVTTTGQTTLTVVTKGGNVTTSGMARDGWWLAGLCGCLVPVCLRLRKKGVRMAALFIVLAGLAGSGIGCTNSISTTNQTGTPLGVHTLKITAAAAVNNVTVSRYAYLTVNVTQ